MIRRVVAAAVLSVLLAAPVQAQNQVLMVNGFAFGTQLPDPVMAAVLGGAYQSYERTNVVWPQRVFGGRLGESVGVGADNLGAAIDTAVGKTGPGEHVTVVGLSAGALVVDEEIDRLADSPIPPDKLNFVVVADSSRSKFNENRYDPILRYQYTVPKDSKYDVTVVTREYDGFADFPDKPNPAAVVNAVVGTVTEHVPSVFTDLSVTPITSKVVNSRGGTTTTYFVRNDKTPLEKIGVRSPKIRSEVRRGYSRNRVD